MLEEMRRNHQIGSSLQAQATLFAEEYREILPDEQVWAEVLIVSRASFAPRVGAPLAELAVAEGQKCARCWRVLPEVGENPRHPALCRRCADAVDSGLVYRAAAE